MAYLPFEYLKEKLLSTGLYEDKEDSAALLELRCYAAGFQALGDEIDVSFSGCGNVHNIIIHSSNPCD